MIRHDSLLLSKSKEMFYSILYHCIQSFTLLFQIFFERLKIRQLFFF